MRVASILLMGLAVPLAAQVKVAPSSDRITVDIDGKPFTTLWIGPEVAKPYLYPLRAASGTVVTRRFPLEEPAPKYIPKASDGQARPTEPKRTGKITNSEGQVTEAQVRGKRANWADYSGEFLGEKAGIAIFDHPANPRHPTYWHTRGYG